MTLRWSADDVPVVLIFLALAALALLSPPQPDTWFHLRAGQEIWDTGALIRSERFSYTSEGRAWYNHEWLSQLLFFGVYSLGGPVLLTGLTGGCALGAAIVSWRMMRGSYEGRLTLLLALVVVMPPAWAVRPQAISLLLFLLAVHLAITDRIVWLPLLVAVWANAHGVVLFGVVVAAAIALDALVWSRDRLRRALVVAVLCAAAPALSPLGWRYWPRVAQTVFEARELGIHEYRSGFEAAAVPFWMMFAAVVTFVIRRARTLRELEPADRQLAIVSVVLGCASVMSIRNAPFFALVAAPALSRLSGIPAPPARRHAAGGGAMWLLAIATLVAVTTVAYKWRDGGADLGWRPISPAAARAMERCPAPIFNTYTAGGPLMWFVPQQRVFVDGRVEAYPVSLLQRSRQADLFGDYTRLFDEYGIRCAIVPSESPMAVALRADRSMTTRFTDDQWTVFVKPPQD